jgi:membrane protein DedA with SNARE-associated domain
MVAKTRFRVAVLVIIGVMFVVMLGIRLNFFGGRRFGSGRRQNRDPMNSYKRGLF